MNAVVIATNSMRRFFRDRTALFFTIALPVLLILLIGRATSGFDDDAYTIGIVASARTGLAADLRDALQRHERIELESYDDRETMAKDVRRGVVPAGIVVPRDYDALLLKGRTASIEMILDQTRGSPAAVRALIAEVISDQGALVQAATFATKHTGVGVRAAEAQARSATSFLRNVSIDVETTTVGTDDDEGYLAPGIGYQAPSNLILFVFITSLAGSALLIQSRSLRVTQRMFATPTPARTILAGEGLARFAIASFQALFIFLVGTLLFGVDWGQPLGAAAVIVLFVLVGTSIGLLFGTIFSTPEQAGSIGSMAGIAMGMLGGCMWPLEIVPEPMQILGHVFPHAWAMDSWIELIGRGGGIGDIAVNLLVLAGYVAVLLPLGAWRLSRALST